MIIVFFVGSFKLGGTEKVSLMIGKELIRRGYDIRFVLLNSTNDYKDPAVDDRTVSLKGESVSSWKKPFILRTRLKKVLRDIRPEKVISFSKGLNLLLLSTFFPVCYFTIESNIFIYTRKLYRRYLQKYAADFSRVKGVIVPSQGLFEACRNYFQKPEKLIQIPNPCDPPETNGWDPPAGAPARYIVSAGRLVWSKGFDGLIRAFAASSLHDQCDLVILGEGPERGSLENLARELDVEDKVHLPGFVQDPYPYFHHAQYFILNTRHESFGNVLVEAMIAGAPVICNDCDYGPRDIIDHGENGFLYDMDNLPQMIGFMEKLMNDELRSRMSARAVNSARQYEVPRVTDLWEQKVIRG